MARRLLLTALVAVLAVALPAAADEEPAASEPFSETVGCLPLDPCSTALPVVECETWDLECNLAATCDGLAPCPAEEELEDDGSTCSAFDLNLPNSNQPVADTLVLDPDGCLRNFIRRTLGLPPTDGDPIEIRSTRILWF
jgi:hypothetical protein